MSAESGVKSHISEAEAGAVVYAAGQFPEIEARVRAHVAECAACGSKLDALRAADREVGELLLTLDEPAPLVSEARVIRAGRAARRPFISPVNRRAAAVLAMLAVSAAVAAAVPSSPLHRLLVRALGSISGSATPNAAPPGPAQRAAPPSPGVLLIPGSTLEVVFRQRDKGGVVHVRAVDGDQVSLSSAEGGATYSVSSGRITVDQSVAGNFDLAIPRSLPEVRIRVGDDIAFERNGGAPVGPDTFTIPLSRRK